MIDKLSASVLQLQYLLKYTLAVVVFFKRSMSLVPECLGNDCIKVGLMSLNKNISEFFFERFLVLGYVKGYKTC